MNNISSFNQFISNMKKDIKKIMVKRGITQSQVGKEIGISAVSFSNILNGKQGTVAKFRLIEDYIGKQNKGSFDSISITNIENKILLGIRNAKKEIRSIVVSEKIYKHLRSFKVPCVYSDKLPVDKFQLLDFDITEIKY